MRDEPTASDDEALTWDGDEVAVAPLPKGWKAVGKGSESVTVAGEESGADADAPTETEEPAAPEPLGNVGLLATGLLAGVYALYVVGWFVATRRIEFLQPAHLDDVMFQISKWSAILAPVLWFTSAIVLTRRHPRWLQFVWLGAGAILLIPWPFVMLGVVGQ